MADIQSDTNATIEVPAAESPQIIQVLTNAPFMFLFAAQFTQNIGAAVSWLALQFLIYDLTKSPGLMGILSIIFWLPYVLFTPFAGVLVDRYDQRKIMLYSNMLSFLASVGFIFIYFFIDQLMITELISTVTTETGTTIISIYNNPVNVIWPFFVLTFINSSAASVFFPSRNAYTRLIVKKKNLLVANSIGATVFQVATIIGYVVAGLLAERNYLGSFIFDASTFAFSMSMMVVVIFIGKKPPDVERPEEANFRAQVHGVFDDLKVGFRTIRDTKKVSYMLLIFSAAIFSFSAFNVLFIVILQGEMGVGETVYGVLQSVMGISGIVTSIVFMIIGKIKRKIAMLNYAMIGATAFLLLFSFTRNIYMIGILMLIFGVAIAIINVSAPTLIQEQIPYEKQGRVFGTQQLLQGIARLAGMGIVSIIAEYVLPMYVLLTSGGLLAILVIWAIIYSTKSGISGDDYLDQPGESKKTIDEAFEDSDEGKKETEITLKAEIDPALE